MTEIKGKALVARLRQRANTYQWDSTTFYVSDADMMLQAADAIEQHEAYRQEVSDALTDIRDNTTHDVHPKLWRYIRAKPADPLVEVLADMGLKPKGGYDWASEFRNALAARGLEIREKQP